MRSLLIFLLILISTTASAADRIAKIHTLMEAQGLVEMFDQQLQFSREYGREHAQQTLRQVLANLNPSDEFASRFTAATNEYIKELEAPWTAEEVVAVWAKLYGARFSDQELDQLIDFYTSPIGKKDVVASRESLPEFNSHFAARAKPLFEQATKSYIERLHFIAKECRCDK